MYYGHLCFFGSDRHERKGERDPCEHRRDRATDTSELTSIKIPAGTVVLACTTYSTGANGNSTTLALKTTTTGAVFGAATAYAADTWKTQAVTTPLVTTTAEETVTVTNAVGAPSVATTITVSLVCASLGTVAAPYSTFTS